MLIIPRAEYENIRMHAAESYPHECCGVLIGHPAPDLDALKVTTVIRGQNVSGDSRRYWLTPHAVERAYNAAKERGLRIVGFYHSHPDQCAQFSQTDLQHAHWFGHSYVITSVERGNPATTLAFRLTGQSNENKSFEVEEIVVT